jgi:hypothetical protein
MRNEQTVEYADNVGARRTRHYMLKRERTQAMLRASGHTFTREQAGTTFRTFPASPIVRTRAVLASDVKGEHVPFDVTTVIRRRDMATVRYIMRAMRDYSARMRTALRLQAMSDAGMTQGARSSGGELWRGITSAPSVRVSARWSSGVQGDRVRASERVSMRDAADVHGDADYVALSPLATVGIATHVLATGENYADAIAIARRDRSRCAVRVIHHTGASVVLPHSHYVAERQARKAANTAHVRNVIQTREASNLALLARIAARDTDSLVATAQGIA